MLKDFRKYLIWNISILVAVFAVFGIAFYFLSDQISGFNRKITTNREVIAARSYAIDNLASLKNDEVQAQSIKKRIDILLPSKDEFLDFQKTLEGLARVRQVGVAFTSRGLTEKTAASAGFVSFDLAVTGNLKNIRDFLNDAESNSPKFLVNFDGFDMSSSQGDNFRASASGRVFLN